MISEAGHYTMFLKFARQYHDEAEVNKKWSDLLEFEAKILESFQSGTSVHGW
jgi:tRNA-(ms[2]io[6]A)-hydroxylase